LKKHDGSVEFPRSLEEWVAPNGSLRRKKKFIYALAQTETSEKNQRFEIVLNAYTPSIADIKITEPSKTFALPEQLRYNVNYILAPTNSGLFYTGYLNTASRNRRR